MNICAWKLTHCELKEKTPWIRNENFRQNTVKLKESRMSNIRSYNIGHKTWDSEKLFVTNSLSESYTYSLSES